MFDFYSTNGFLHIKSSGNFKVWVIGILGNRAVTSNETNTSPGRRETV